MRVINGVEVIGGKGQAFAQIMLQNVGCGSIQVEICPCRVKVAAATNVEQFMHHGRFKSKARAGCVRSVVPTWRHPVRTDSPSACANLNPGLGIAEHSDCKLQCAERKKDPRRETERSAEHAEGVL